MLPASTIFLVSLAGLTLLAVVVGVSTGSGVAVLVVVAIGALVGYILTKLGILDVKSTDSGLDISFYEKVPTPAQTIDVLSAPKSLEQKEVFHVAGNQYTYDEAPALCAAYDAELATYDQVNTAYEAGAEWCGYGWTQGGMALFPTQQTTWNDLQQEMDVTKRTACGRPGVNGGYFNPASKFGVNCYGVKPKNTTMKFPLPIPGTDENSFNQMVNKFKNMINTMTISSFNRDGWSEWNLKSHIPSSLAELEKDIKSEL